LTRYRFCFIDLLLSNCYFILLYKIGLTLNELDELRFELFSSACVRLGLLSRPKPRTFHLLNKIGVNRVEIRIGDHCVLRDQQTHEVLILLEDAKIAILSSTDDLEPGVRNLLTVLLEGL